MKKSTYQAISRTVFWWQYQPADEREVELYQRAYKRFFWSVIVCVFITTSVLELYLTQLLSMPTLSTLQLLRIVECWLLVVLITSYIVGSSAFYGHELVLKKQNVLITKLLPWMVAVDLLVIFVLWMVGKM